MYTKGAYVSSCAHYSASAFNAVDFKCKKQKNQNPIACTGIMPMVWIGLLSFDVCLSFVRALTTC